MEAVKAAADRRDWRHFSHRELRDAVQHLAREMLDPELVRLYAIAEALCANFSENWMDPDTARLYAEDARCFLKKLRPLVRE